MLQEEPSVHRQQRKAVTKQLAKDHLDGGFIYLLPETFFRDAVHLIKDKKCLSFGIAFPEMSFLTVPTSLLAEQKANLLGLEIVKCV